MSAKQPSPDDNKKPTTAMAIDPRDLKGTLKRIASLYHLVPSTPFFKPSLPSPPPQSPFQPDMFGAPAVDLATYRRGHLPSDLAAAVRAEMRARGTTQDELAALIGISRPQLANALDGRFGLSPDPAARLLARLRKAVAA